MRSPIRLFVTDLDNTLYDWVSFFAVSFYEMVSVAAGLLGVPEEILLDELRDVHRRHHNSEHPFALLETPSVRNRFGALSRAEQKRALDEAFHAFNRKRAETLVLYPTVKETLEGIASLGIPIVGHTEATVPNALFRLRKLGVVQYFSGLYAATPAEAPHPDADFETYVPAFPVRLLALDERKPDPRILRDICHDFRVPAAQGVYVGDSIARDIGMAKQAGFWAAWAQYGTRYEPSMWQKLVRITHWSAEDVARAEAARVRYGSTRPDQTLAQFSDIMAYIEGKSGTLEGTWAAQG